ncbi:MAG TPA: hypothetical protein VN680_12935 [Burkholderiaceae bacterium]|jgi:hypothetical protein|nr:hypothetical protein [Burkholderiaceae bacterium]
MRPMVCLSLKSASNPDATQGLANADKFWKQRVPSPTPYTSAAATVVQRQVLRMTVIKITTLFSGEWSGPDAGEPHETVRFESYRWRWAARMRVWFINRFPGTAPFPVQRAEVLEGAPRE